MQLKRLMPRYASAGCSRRTERQREIVDEHVMIVLDRVDDAQDAGARDEIDEVLDEAFDLVAVADRVDDGQALRGREIVRRRHRAHERDPRRICERGAMRKAAAPRRRRIAISW